MINFKYTFKILLKNKNLIFWSILWPIVLVSIFSMAFSNFVESSKLDTIPIGVVDNTNYEENEYLSQALDKLSEQTDEKPVLHIEKGNLDTLNQMLENREIDAIILVEDEVKIIVKENGIEQTVVKYIVDEISQTENLVNLVIEKKGMEGLEVLDKISSDKEVLNNISNTNINMTMIEYFSVIAMACLYSSLLSIETVKNYLANTSTKGARIAISPAKRFSLIFSGLIADCIIQIISISFLLFYMTTILKIQLGDQMNFVILLALIGSIAGIAFGTLMRSLTFKNENTRIGITNVVILFGCFCSGMMGITEKYLIDKNFPLLNKINPANMITDGFYALYYYENTKRFKTNILSLTIFIILCITISTLMMRRKRYDSI